MNITRITFEYDNGSRAVFIRGPHKNNEGKEFLWIVQVYENDTITEWYSNTRQPAQSTIKHFFNK